MIMHTQHTLQCTLIVIGWLTFKRSVFLLYLALILKSRNVNKRQKTILLNDPVVVFVHDYEMGLNKCIDFCYI